MNSINDLKKTSMDETVHESELSQIKDDQHPSQSSIVINPRRKVRHRSTESTDGLQTVNPSQFIEKPAPKKKAAKKVAPAKKTPAKKEPAKKKTGV